jgi:uncharacterized protein
MHFALDLLLAAVAFLGHFALAVWLFNRLHALPWPVRLIKVLDKFIVLGAALVCFVFLARWVATGRGLAGSANETLDAFEAFGLAYAALCGLVALAAVPLWLIPKLTERVPAALADNDTAIVDVLARVGFRPVHGRKTTMLAAFPGNQILELAVQRKTLRLASLPRELEGFTIAHLSDLHMTGHLGPEFYDVVVEETNALEPDLIVITGDILEKQKCLAWGPAILGRLKARYGVYFILGNHEMRLRSPALLRQALCDQGLIDLGSRAYAAQLNGVDVLLAGNELPWFGSAPALSHSPTPPLAFRILLSHTPDQLPWAKANGFDLMLAGHNHGGQIRLPYLGALIVPSRYGWRYAGGVYHEPPTVLHVSRGISGDHCLRLNCRPEIALLRLTKS